MPAPITASLAAITTTWPQLLADTYAIHGALGSGMPGAAESPALPGGTGRLSAIADTTRVLQAWVRVVLEDRPGQQLTGEHLEDGVPGLCHWLHPHADWLHEHTAGAATDELDDLAQQIASLLTPSAIKRPPVGPCPYDDCGGQIRGYIDTDHSEQADLACDLDPDHAWDRDHWVTLSQRIHDDTPRYLPAPALAAWLSRRFRTTVTPSKVRVWAHRYPVSLPRDHAGHYDRIAAATWYMHRKATQATA